MAGATLTQPTASSSMAWTQPPSPRQPLMSKQRQEESLSALAILLTWATSSAPGSYGASGDQFSQCSFLLQPFPSTSIWLKRGILFTWARRSACLSLFVTASPGSSSVYSGVSQRPVVLPPARNLTNLLPIGKQRQRLLVIRLTVVDSCRATSGLSSLF